MAGIPAAPVFLQLSAQHTGLAISLVCLRCDVRDVLLSASALMSHTQSNSASVQNLLLVG